jgi:hypothetical protein
MIIKAYALCPYAEFLLCQGLPNMFTMLSVLMLSVIVLNFVMLNFIGCMSWYYLKPLKTGACTIKLFKGIIKYQNKLVFVAVSHFYFSQLFVLDAGAYPSGTTLRGPSSSLA